MDVLEMSCTGPDNDDLDACFWLRAIAIRGRHLEQLAHSNSTMNYSRDQRGVV